MNAFRKIIFLLIFSGIFASTPVAAQTDGGWKKADSKNFQMIGNAPEKDFGSIAFKLENFRQSFFNLFGQTERKSPIPTRVLIFKSKTDFDIYLQTQSLRNKNELKGNIFQEGQDSNYIVFYPNERGDFEFSEVYHQYFHYLLKNYVGKSKIPAWLNEGLATIYERFLVNEDLKTSFQPVEQNKLEFLAQNKLLPAEFFFNTDYYTLNQQEKHGVGVFYAQSAAVVNYLIYNSDDEKFKSFLNLLSNKNSANQSLIKSFQTDFSTIEKNLKPFIGQQLAEKYAFAKNQSPAISNLKFSTISNAETEAFLGDFLYQSNRFDEAELHLPKSLSLNPLASFPKSTLGLVKLRQFNFEEAFRHLEKSLEFKDVNYLNYYRYAFALSRQGMTEYGLISNYDAETAEKIRELLKKGIELNPDFAESYNLYALIGFVRNEEIDECLEFIAKALETAPENDWFLLRKSELQMRKENFTEARKNAIKIYQNAVDEGMRLYAQNTIQRIDSLEFQLLNAKRNQDYPYNDAISEIPFSAEEIARLRAKAMRESLNAVLRRPAADEKRVLGNIVRINCEKNQVDFAVKIGVQVVNLQANSFEALYLTTYNAELTRAEIGCGTLNRDNSAVIIYRKSAESKPDVSGEIVSIEFVPKEFTLPENN